MATPVIVPFCTIQPGAFGTFRANPPPARFAVNPVPLDIEPPRSSINGTHNSGSASSYVPVAPCTLSPAAAAFIPAVMVARVCPVPQLLTLPLVPPMTAGVAGKAGRAGNAGVVAVAAVVNAAGSVA